MKKVFLMMCVSVSLLSGCASIQELPALKGVSGQQKEQSVVGTIQAVRNFQGKKSQLNENKSILGTLNGFLGKQEPQKEVIVPMQEIFVLMPDSKTVNFTVENQNFGPGMTVRITLKGNKAEIKAI